MKACLLSRLSGTVLSRLAAITLVSGCSMLSSCASLPELNHPQTPNQTLQPEKQLPDYLSTQCADIWQQEEPSTLANPLYWLRGMECAQRLSPAEARTEAREWPALTWQDTFKRGILLSPAKITPVERRRYMQQLDMLATDIPLQVRSLFILWRDGERSQLKLSEERNRYSKLQQVTDEQLDELRQAQQRLSGELEVTTRKLETLSDIERQLSNRKPGSNYVPEAHSKDSQDTSDQSLQEIQP